MQKINFQKLKKEVQEKIQKAGSLQELDSIFNQYFGPGGKIKTLTQNLKKLPLAKRKNLGKKINEFKEFFDQALNLKMKELKEKIEKNVKREKIDVTIPGKKIVVGHLHPLTLIIQRIQEIFQGMGFAIVEGPEIENEWYNFDALNIPDNHPARDLWDTFYLKKIIRGQKLLLRTHTSPVQVRFMEKHQPPFRIIAPGKVFRHEATDKFHEINFHQVEGLMVDKDVTVADFKGIIENFFEIFFKQKIKIRLRPSYFPFTEPSFEIDIPCLSCKGEGCEICNQEGWIEIMGAGMVHPQVFKNSGLSPNEWQGFAFGMGIERLAMLKYRIDDIRLFFSGDLRFLNQF